MGTQLTNWAGNVIFRARHVYRPSSVAELQELVAGSSRIRALGTGHSFSRVADTTGDLVRLDGLPRLLELDEGNRTVTVGAGTRYGELAVELHRRGYALHNLGSLPHISVAGACATGTHGSGSANGNLASAVTALQMVGADGDLIRLSRARDDSQFCGAVIALGALGVVTALTLVVEPSYDLVQYVFDDLPRQQLDEHADEIFAGAYSVSLFTDWRGPRINQVWLKRRVGSGDEPPADWFGARRAGGPRHPVPGMPTDSATQQLGVVGPWHERLPHFRLAFTPSSGEELQTEYLLPREHARGALAALDPIADRIAPVLQISELRTVTADDLWLSPSYRRDSIAIHFTWVQDLAAVAPVVAAVEHQLAPFQPRPHWGKVFTMPADVVAAQYERLADFRSLRDRLDPAGRFGNEFVDRYLGSTAEGSGQT